MPRYGIIFYSEAIDCHASVYFEAENAFEARKNTYKKDGWFKGDSFFIEEKDYGYYSPNKRRCC